MGEEKSTRGPNCSLEEWSTGDPDQFRNQLRYRASSCCVCVRDRQTETERVTESERDTQKEKDREAEPEPEGNRERHIERRRKKEKDRDKDGDREMVREGEQARECLPIVSKYTEQYLSV